MYIWGGGGGEREGCSSVWNVSSPSVVPLVVLAIAAALIVLSLGMNLSSAMLMETATGWPQNNRRE